jgi:hypothetical protein
MQVSSKGISLYNIPRCLAGTGRRLSKDIRGIESGKKRTKMKRSEESCSQGTGDKGKGNQRSRRLESREE